MDKELMIERFTKALPMYDSEASVQKYVIDRLMEMLHRSCAERLSGREHCHGDGQGLKVLEIGCGTGLLTKRIVSDLSPARLWANDICPAAEGCISSLAEQGCSFLCGDAEKIAFPTGLDLVISSSAVQWVEDLPAFLAKCAASLVEGGVLAISTYGPANLKEIRELTGMGLKYWSASQLSGMLPSGLRILNCETEIVTSSWPSPSQVLRHLKRTGVTGIGHTRWTRSDLASFEKEYIDRFPLSDGVSLTYEPIWIIAEKEEWPDKTDIYGK